MKDVADADVQIAEVVDAQITVAETKASAEVADVFGLF